MCNEHLRFEILLNMVKTNKSVLENFRLPPFESTVSLRESSFMTCMLKV